LNETLLCVDSGWLNGSCLNGHFTGAPDYAGPGPRRDFGTAREIRETTLAPFAG